MPTETLTPSAADPHLTAAIAREERRRGMLERLSGLGMALVERITERTMAAPAEDEPRHDPARSFAQLSRAVRLTLALEARSDERILALRNGDLPSTSAPARAAEAALPFPDPQPFVPPAVRRDSPCAHRNRVRDAIWGAVNQQVGDPYDARWLLDRVHERLVEGEDYDRLVFRDFRASVEAICADLGLQPDWGCWSDDAGFTFDPLIPHYHWADGYSYSPERAADNARARDERRANAAAPEREPHSRQ